eukprot:TRINITY_DN10999_c0_g1_i1.p1 TRINITY_DN10999_c0_g1~~TRINITY_DN10999_c0_g1_i1.p1  ORF type:complete len:582 (+),score=114.44 TRINITY_DN10999_c0_g1_i1:250-1746(+)
MDSCCRQIGYNWPTSLHTIASEAPTKLYDLKVCRRMEGVSEKSTAAELAKAFVDTQIDARKSYCANYGSSAARDHFGQEYTKWGGRYFVWSRVVASGCTSPQSCYEASAKALDDAKKLAPEKLVSTADVVAAGKHVKDVLANPGKTDCYYDDITADTGDCGSQDCEWAQCSKPGYFMTGLRWTSIHSHDGYELTPNGYEGAGQTVKCCRPSFSFSDTVGQAVPPAVVELAVAHAAACADSSACLDEATTAVAGFRGTLQDKGGKRSLEMFTEAVKDALTAGFGECGCNQYDLGGSVGCGGEDCEWASCPDDGSFLTGLLFTKLHDHDGYELVPNGYSSSLKSTKCCTSCLNVILPDVNSQGSGDPQKPQVKCSDALECWESAIQLLDTALDGMNAKVSHDDLQKFQANIRGAFDGAGGWTAEDTWNLGDDAHACKDDCEWAQCGAAGTLMTRQLYTKLHDHDGFELVPNSYGQKSTHCAKPSFSVSSTKNPTQVQVQV